MNVFTWIGFLTVSGLVTVPVAIVCLTVGVVVGSKMQQKATFDRLMAQQQDMAGMFSQEDETVG